MKHVNVGLIPKHLYHLQKRLRVEITKNMNDYVYTIAENPIIIELIITSDETWAYEYYV